MFRKNDPLRFCAKHHHKVTCTKLYSQGSLVTDANDLLKCWVDHFSSLAQSERSTNESLKESLNDLASKSICNCDNILDPEIDVEEVEFAICHLKRNRAGGADNVSPEHLKFSGKVFRKWLCEIYNHICQLERIPQCFKDGVIIPAVFKGKGKDPLHYRGISLTSVLAKVFEIILSHRITPLLECAGIPQVTQTAYRGGSHLSIQYLQD